MGECADPEECKTIADLGITMLAAGIGNIHGKYPEGWPGLRFDVLDAIKAKVGDMPLVLHGGSGIPDAMVQDAIRRGVSKINVNTECQLALTLVSSSLPAHRASLTWSSTKSKFSAAQARLDRSKTDMQGICRINTAA